MKKQLSKSEIEELNQEIQLRYGVSPLSKKQKIELISEEQRFIKADKITCFFYKDDVLFPTLKFLLKEEVLPKVIIDMPAIKFITSGADLMKPGIKQMSNFKKGAAVVVVDELHNKPIALGIALFSSEDALFMEKGKIIQIIHYVGDSIWNS